MLNESVKTKNYDEVKKLLQEESKVFSKDDLSAALIIAVKNGYEDIVELLLLNGADPNFVPQGGHWSAIQNAVENKELNVLKMLVQSGGGVNLSDEKGFTLLHLAIDVEADTAYQADEKPSIDITRFLLESGAKPDRKDNSGKSPLDLAIQYEYKDAVELLKKQLGINN